VLGNAIASELCDAVDEDDDDDSPDKKRPFLDLGADECALPFPPRFPEYKEFLLLLLEELWRVFRERERELSFRFLPFGGLPRLPEDDEPLLLPLNDIQAPRVEETRHEEGEKEEKLLPRKMQSLPAQSRAMAAKHSSYYRLCFFTTFTVNF
jgi:hypothetical protein